MRLLYTLLFLFSTLLAAENKIEDEMPYSLRLGAGYAEMNDLQNILKFDFAGYEKKTYAINLDGGWRVGKDIFTLPFDVYLKGGVSYFNENGYQDNFFEGTLYVKVYWKLDFWKNRVRIGFGEGISYAQELPIAEIDDAYVEDAPNDPTARLLNYLDISVDFDLGRLIKVESLRDFYVGYTIKHRSGVKGLYSGAHGGSNYLMLTLEKNF